MGRESSRGSKQLPTIPEVPSLGSVTTEKCAMEESCLSMTETVCPGQGVGARDGIGHPACVSTHLYPFSVQDILGRELRV